MNNNPNHKINSDTIIGNDFDTIAQSCDNNVDDDNYACVDSAKLQFERENVYIDLDGIQQDLSHVKMIINVGNYW